MNDKKLDQITAELVSIKKLLVLLLKKNQVKGGQIAQALGVSGGRVSQLAATRKYKKRKPVTGSSDRLNTS